MCLFSVFIPQTFKEDKYLKDAMDCSDVIWQRGLLRKGYGICHGTAGNGYSFLSLYNLTQDRKYLYRACKVSSAASQRNRCSLSHPSACARVNWGGSGLMCTGAGWDIGWDNRARHLLHFTHVLTGRLQLCMWGKHCLNKQSETHKCSVRGEGLNVFRRK